MGDARHAISVTIVRSNALCLLKRLSRLSPNARRAGERQRVVQALDARRQEQAQAYHLAKRHQGLSKVGRTFIPS